MKHRLILEVRCTQSLEAILKTFPKTILAQNLEAEENKSGHKPLEVVYVDKVESAETVIDRDRRTIE